jgi:hypothetical protein
MPELGKSGSVGALGGNAQGDPANPDNRSAVGLGRNSIRMLLVIKGLLDVKPEIEES